MRLWHQKLIPYLDRQRLLGQHRECAALRGRGWGKKHKIVDYVFTHHPNFLVAYYFLIMDEMERRGYHSDPIWRDVNWRGNTIGIETNWADEAQVLEIISFCRDNSAMIYPEHNNNYMQECIINLKEKGVDINANIA